MPSFDSNAFLTRQSNDPGNTTENIALSFGVPACLFNLDILNAALIPSPVLIPLRLAMEEAEAKTQAVINKIARWIKINLGISIFPDRNSQFGFFSEINKFGQELGGASFLQAVGKLMGTINAVAGSAQQIYQNYQNTVAQIEDIQACFGQLQDFLNNSGEGAERRELTRASVYQSAIQGENAFAQAQLAVAQEAQAKALNVIQIIDTVLGQRELDPDLEPKLIGVTDDDPVESVFRLQAGPPLATNGEFILSVDGLYYDSSQGLMPALMELANKRKSIEREKHWKLDFDPNLGGRGNQLTSDNVRFYFNSILDPEIIDESNALQKFYNSDRILLNIKGQRDRKIFDVSSEISELISNESATILIDNMKQTLISEAAFFDQKLNRRKKQIELAVKAPVLYGKGPIYNPGEIPINDFSYLEGTNFLMDVEQQRKLVIKQDDVEGVVLPLEVKYTQKIETVDPVVIDHLLLAGIARGAIIDHDAPASTAPSLAITETVLESNLIALYNLLTASISKSSDMDFGLFNSSEKGDDYNAKIVGDPSALFQNGLGIAYLEGVSSNSYIRLPAVTELQDLVYSQKGGSFEAWIQASGLLDSPSYNLSSTAGDLSGLYRLILANENTGITSSVVPQSDREVMSLDEGTGFVRGMIMGFTRDCRFTASGLGRGASNEDEDNDASAAVFVLAPTQSYDSSSLGFINKEPCNANNTQWHGITIPVSSQVGSAEGVAFSDCGTAFCHLAVTFDPPNDTISVYLDSKLIGASGYFDTFGTGARKTPKIPSLTVSSSFEHSASGPRLDTFFTPWIIGGGYTDGAVSGFTGSHFGGFVSGFQGKIGGIKFYSEPLSSSEVAQNYNANKNFFKFVKLL